MKNKNVCTENTVKTGKGKDNALKILAIDSTAKTSTVALTENERLIGLSILNTNNTHSVTLLPSVEGILSGAGITARDVDLFVCSAGPGSFTGVRIGAAAVKGLAFADGKKCIGVSSLEALAMNVTEGDGTVCAVMDARRNQLYNALFEIKGKTLKRLTPDRVITTDELSEELSGCTGKIYVVGDGREIALTALCGHELPDISETAKYQNAYSVALLGLKEYLGLSEQEREGLTASALSSVYLRASQAEREREEKIKNGRA